MENHHKGVKTMNKEIVMELKKVEIDILKEFVAVCNKLNLRYYLLGGTLLGAVRHQGFIPWDDDIDVGMPREDYEVFIHQGQKLLPEHLFIQTIETDPAYVNTFAKIRNSRTTFVESSSGRKRINHGVFIDVFPLDYYPEEEVAQAQFDSRKKWFARRVGITFSLPQNRTWKGLLRRTVFCVMMPSLKGTIQGRERLYHSVGKTNLLANHGGAWGKKEIVPAEWYGEGVPVMFEGMQVTAPAEYDKWLTQVYGDYMQLPPVEKRVGHHYTDVIDLERPYTEYPPHKKMKRR